MASNQQVARTCCRCKCRNAEADRSLCKDCVYYQARASKKYHLKVRMDAFNAYGGPQCNCCSTLVNEFLTIDHINNDGAAHKREIGGGGIKLYLWLKRKGYPPGFQVLCMNCNFAKGKYGLCPHQL